MCELCIKAVCLECHVSDPFVVGMMVDGTHEHKVSHYHDDDDPDVIGKGEHQTTEVVLMHGIVLA